MGLLWYNFIHLGHKQPKEHATLALAQQLHI